MAKKAKQARTRRASASSAKRKKRSPSGTSRAKSYISLNQISLALKASGVGIWEWTIRSNQVLWTDEVLVIFGLTKNQFDGQFASYVALVHPDDREMVNKAIQQTINNKTPYFIEHRLLRRDGSTRWLQASGALTYNKKGQVTKMTGSVLDITEKRLHEKQHLEWRARYDLLTESSGLIIYDFFIASGVIEWNSTLTDVLGYLPEEVDHIDKWLPLVHPDDREQSLSEVEWAEKELSKYDLEFRIKDKLGHYRHLHVRGFFVSDESQKAIRMLGSITDITEQKKAAEDKEEIEITYQHLVSNASDAIFTMSLEPDTLGQIITANKAAAEMHGYSLGEFLQLNIKEIDTPEDYQTISHRIARLIDNDRFVFEVNHRRKDGSVFPVEVVATIFEVKGKKILLAIDRDISERKQVEQRLRESEQRFRILHEASYSGIAVHDMGVIIDANQGLANICGYSIQELIGMDGLKLIIPEHREMVMQKIRGSYELPYDSKGLRKDGTVYYLEIHGKSIPYKGRKVRITEFRDISERKQAEEKIKEQNSRLLAISQSLRRKNEQLEEFTQIVSHNLRSPAGNINSLIELLEKSGSEEDKSHILSLLRESSGSLISTLRELNEVLQIKQNKNIEKQELLFEEVFSKVKNMLTARISEINAEVTCRFDEVPSIQYPNIYLESIFLNLLSNALKYNEPSRVCQIHFQTKANEGNQIILEVQDNGLGIDLRKYGHQIFKLRKTFHKHPESRGVGLFLVKSQIETMGGEIKMKSEEGKGSTFVINFNKNPIDA